jgi:molecular chaperone DnaK
VTHVVGIDLGTTNTVVAAFRDGQGAALPDERDKTLIPSVVSFHPNGSVLVGQAAKDRRVLDPNSTIFSVKRLIGRSWDTEEVRKARSRLPFEMREGPGQAALVFARGETYTLPEISAFVLRKAKSVAEAALGGPVERAVITVPANFNDLQRAATKVAGRVAGLEVLRILNEPTAAALAYGYGKSSAERLAVYDFGGGTFDVTLLDLSSNVFEVLATAGNTFLGGDDIDAAIAERMAESFLRQHRYDVRTDPVLFDRFRIAAEELKQKLSTETNAEVRVPEVTHGPGGKAIDLVFPMTRGEFEVLAAPIVDQTFDVCREALGVARLGVSDLDQVLLVGGSTRIPLVQSRVEEFFRRAGHTHVNPDEVVAIGAAIQASALAGAERRRGTLPAAPAPARRASTTPGVGRSTRPTGGPPLPEAADGRLRLSSMGEPDASEGPIPETQPFEPRHKAPTRPGLAPPARPPASDEPRVAQGSTLLGMGSRGLVRTGAGLGPEALEAKGVPAATLVSAETSAQAASDEVGRPASAAGGPGMRALSPPLASPPPPPVPPPPAAPPRLPPLREPPPSEASAPFILPTLEAPAARGADDALLEPVEVEALDEASLPLPEAPDDTPTRVLRAPPREPAVSRTAPEPAPPSRPPPPPSATPARAFPAATLPLRSAPVAATAPLEVPTVPPAALAPASPPPPAPVLIDVTPLTLSVETVGGYCDALIARNTPVPCDRTRDFVTASDNQTVVRVRVGQGESIHFQHNTLLGELELSGLRPGLRGTVQIAVTFTLDTNGMLSVSARDKQTGRATTAQVHLVGLPEPHHVGTLAARHAAQRAG